MTDSPVQPADAPTRALSLAGASNFRDLGGYIGHDGRPVRWRTLFRSDHLAALTPDDQAELARLGLARAFDFRGVHERAASDYELPGEIQDRQHWPSHGVGQNRDRQVGCRAEFS